MKDKAILGVMIAIALAITIGVTPIMLLQQLANGAINQFGGTSGPGKFGGSIAVSGMNVYATWWNNKTGDFEVMFRASTDSGHTFWPKINLSNSPGVASPDAQITAEGKNVYIIW
jgi:hypothetical protein